MRWGALLFALGWLALVLQAALSTILPPPYCPDLGLLVVIAIGLTWERAATGLALSAGLGFVADIFSGSLLGQHALLRMTAYIASRLASRQLNLRGPLPLAVFAAGLSFVYAVAVLALTAFFVGRLGVGNGWLVDALQHSLVNAALAPSMSALVVKLATWTGADDQGRTPLRLEPRGGGA